VLRFWKVSFQTVAAPVLTAVLYLLIFGHVLEGRVTVFGSVGYTSFLIPGLVMMSVLQNAFANSSSSIIQSKIMGSMVFVLLTPLSHWGWFLAYVGSSVIRGIAVGRRNWTFAGSDAGGRRAAAMYTLIETAKLNDIDPRAYLADVLARLPGHPAKQIAELLPWNWRKVTVTHAQAT